MRGHPHVCGDVITDIREVLPIKQHMQVDGVNCNKLYITFHSSNVIAVTLTIVHFSISTQVSQKFPNGMKHPLMDITTEKLCPETQNH